MKLSKEISGIGVDCIETSRFNDIISKKKTLDNLFTESEKKYCFAKKFPQENFAARFAAKEAIIKAFNQSEDEILFPKDIEILNDKGGLPFVNLPSKENLKIMLSLSHSDTLAIAFVVIKKI